MIVTITGSTGGFTHQVPVRRLVARPRKPALLNKGFQEYHGMPICDLPVSPDAARNLTQDMAGEVGNTDPRKQQEAHVIRYQGQSTLTCLWIPTNEGITACHPPGRCSEQQTPQRTSMTIKD